MSASRDKTQRFTFVGSNLYQIHTRGVEPDQAPGLRTSQVIKSGTKILKPSDIESNGLEVTKHKPVEFLTRTAFNPALNLAPVREHETTQDLKKHLTDLQDVQSRLSFMLQELKNLVDDD